MLKSDNINELGAALAKAQAVIEGALKDTANPFFKSKYADLSSVWVACRKPLTDNGLSVTQMLTESSGGIGVETVLIHSSGQWLSSTFTMPVSKNDAQGVGSAATYARRYALAAMVGVSPEDDDGNAATKAAPKEVMDEDTVQGFIHKINLAADAKDAKRIYGEALKKCSALGDVASQTTLKSVLLAKWAPASAAN